MQVCLLSTVCLFGKIQHINLSVNVCVLCMITATIAKMYYVILDLFINDVGGHIYMYNIVFMR